MANDTKEKKTKTNTTAKKATTSTAKKASSKPTTKKTSTKKPTTKKTTTKPKTDTKKKETRVIEKIIEIEETTPIIKDVVIEKRPEEKFDDGEYLIIKKNHKEEPAPKTILGNDLPDGNEEEARNARKKFYAKDALLFAFIIPILDLFAMLFIDSYKPILITNDVVANYVITLVLDFVLIYIVTYLIDLIVGEEAVKKTRK